MKILLKIIPVVLIIALAFLTIISVTKDDAPEISESPSPEVSVSPSAVISPSPSVEPSEDPSPSPSVYDGPVNPLTGMPCDESIVNNRPYAVMINNIISAQPQLGVSQADIIYEIVVEGGITRMMALFQDVSDIGDIGSVRSARPYYIRIALGYDAVYIHAGGSPDAYSVMKSTQILHYDGVNGSRQDIFYRDPERRSQLGFEHSLLTNGALISEYLPAYGVRLEHTESYDNGMVFSEDAAPDGGVSAEDVKVYFSSSKTTSFKYSEADGVYYASQYGDIYADGSNGEQIGVSNILVLYTDVSRVAGDTEGRMSVDTTGSGSGVFFCGGYCEPIKWSRASITDPYTYTRNDGSSLSLCPGTTYISIISSDNSLDIS